MSLKNTLILIIFAFLGSRIFAQLKEEQIKQIGSLMQLESLDALSKDLKMKEAAATASKHIPAPPPMPKKSLVTFGGKSETATGKTTIATTSKSVPPPPPPMPKGSLVTGTASKSVPPPPPPMPKGSLVTGTASKTVPPPPPPMPGLHTTKSTTASKKPAQGGGREAMMQGIREGAQLKPASERKLKDRPIASREALLEGIREGGKLKPAGQRELKEKPKVTGREALLEGIRSGKQLKPAAERKLKEEPLQPKGKEKKAEPSWHDVIQSKIGQRREAMNPQADDDDEWND